MMWIGIDAHKQVHQAVAVGPDGAVAQKVTFPHDLDANAFVDQLKTQLRPLADRGLNPDHIEVSEQYAERLDSKFLRGHIVVISIYENDVAFGGIDVCGVASPGILRVVV